MGCQAYENDVCCNTLAYSSLSSLADLLGVSAETDARATKTVSAKGKAFSAAATTTKEREACGAAAKTAEKGKTFGPTAGAAEKGQTFSSTTDTAEAGTNEAKTNCAPAASGSDNEG